MLRALSPNTSSHIVKRILPAASSLVINSRLSSSRLVRPIVSCDNSSSSSSSDISTSWFSGSTTSTTNTQQQLHHRFKSTAVLEEENSLYDEIPREKKKRPNPAVVKEIHRLKHLRNVGILAHVDAGKTTVTERMLALAGVVRSAGCVDDGNTVTDYLPAERERGITIQSAAVSFDWGWHNNKRGDDYEANDNVQIQLIDTPGHVDFSVEVNRSVAVLDGAVLVIDAVAGVQAQTETVWRALTKPSLNNHERPRSDTVPQHQTHKHEPLPCLALINKMDKDGCHFGRAMQSLKQKLPGANPIATQLPLFRTNNNKATTQQASSSDGIPSNIIAVSPDDVTTALGEFVGVVDLIHMRAIVWPDKMNLASNGGLANVENCVPNVFNLLQPSTHEPIDPNCQVTEQALEARFDFIEALAEVDPQTEEYYLNDIEPSNAELRAGLRRATLSHKALPVMAGAALRGLGVEPLLDSIADLLPSPLDRLPPALTPLEFNDDVRSKKKCGKKLHDEASGATNGSSDLTLGHPLYPKLLALAFKVVHMKGRGGSGDGRVVFARVYSGKLKDREQVKVISPPAPGEAPEKPRLERIGGMLELYGGRFDNVTDGMCQSGEVCALVGLKGVATGDTIMLGSDSYGGGGESSTSKQRKGSRKGDNLNTVCLAGVASPKPVLTVRLEVASSDQQARLSEALALMTIEDPSLSVEETDSTTLLSGLGELHIEVTLDRLYREFGLEVVTGPPSVAYRETITETIESNGWIEYDRTIGGTRLQGAVDLTLVPNLCQKSMDRDSSCMLLSEPVVTVSRKVRDYLGLDHDMPEDELMFRSDIVKALIQGCRGALKRGPIKSYEMASVQCIINEIDAEGGLPALKSLPGSIRAAAAHAVSHSLENGHEKLGRCTVLEPTMSVEVTLPTDMVGSVLSDITGRRGAVGEVLMNDEGSSHSKALVRGDVPLVEILGYANSLRSLTGGEGAFSAEYKGHSAC